MEPSWNLASGPPRTTPEPIRAETPKLSAVGGEKKNTQVVPFVLGCQRMPAQAHPHLTQRAIDSMRGLASQDFNLLPVRTALDESNAAS